MESRPYEIYYFHNEPLGSETQAFHARIKELVKTRPDHPILNATLIPVDLSKDPQLKQVLPDIKQLWTKHQKELSPGYLVTNPQGKVLPVPSLECAELGMTLRVLFAAWSWNRVSASSCILRS